jgi:6-pyruvoyltetrahydropterin/6-carboxytetrahydropterin synthase
MNSHQLTITRKFEFDAGHRIPNHLSLCKNLHGHRYVLELTITGNIQQENQAHDFGMIIDFGEIKQLIQTHLIQKWDHAFLVYAEDTILLHFLNSLPDHKTVVLPCVPTAENLVKLAFDTANQILHTHYKNNILIKHARLYETPNCWADYSS